MDIKLSHSARDMLQLCGQKYKFHYIDRLRSPQLNSPLFFGNALDVGFSRILLEKKSLFTPEELEMLPKSEEQVFLEAMENFKHNNKMEHLPQNLNCVYFFSDFSSDLLKDFTKLKEYAPDIEDFLEFYEQCCTVLRDKKKLTDTDKAVYNYMNWLSLCEKGKLMLQAYRRDVLPEIEEVFHIQKKIEVSNASGDSIRGLIDFIASFNVEPGVRYICDNKSSSKPYKEDSVADSDQLATYAEAEDIYNASYIVVLKTVYKKAPIIRTQIIKGKITENALQNTFDKFEQAVFQIEEEIFDKNWNSCYSYGSLCPYYQLCKGGKKDGLYKV